MSNEQPPVTVERISVSLVRESVDALAKIQERTGLKKVDAVNRALMIYEFIDAELRSGNDIIVRDADGRDQVVKFIF